MTQANYYISFAILSESLEDPSFHLGKAIHVINVVLDYLYIGLLIMCYVLSLGNRPQGAKWGYKLAFVGFAFITIYMTVRSISTTLSVDRYNDALRVTVQFAAIFLAVKGIESVVRADRDFSLSTEFFANPLFRNIIFSILATIGFDVSWGTKGDDSTPPKLGVVPLAKPENPEVVVKISTKVEVIDRTYDEAIRDLYEPDKEEPITPEEPKGLELEQDYYRSFRTHNATGTASTKGAQHTINGYMAFILFSITGLALIRFVGSTLYMIMRLSSGE
ncbi:Chitin synthase 3 [Trametes pubescens]|uniref:chitin synthase n=1 Tax=Trametes pubescens TaxID=154538 RepID=A0A1M2V8F8_TRAPU|nr:Chitin synthase 3 [Trametes pubescens]